MKNWGLIAIVCFSLGGCVSQQQQLEQQQALSAAQDQQCKAYGAQAGSDAYVACRTQLAQMAQNQQNIDANRRSAALMAVGQGMQNASQSYYRAAAARPHVNCTSTPNVDGSVQTNCY